MLGRGQCPGGASCIIVAKVAVSAQSAILTGKTFPKSGPFLARDGKQTKPCNGRTSSVFGPGRTGLVSCGRVAVLFPAAQLGFRETGEVT